MHYFELHDFISLVYIFYVISIFWVFIINPRYSFLLLFSTKFTLDLFWNHAVIFNFSILKLTGGFFLILIAIYYVRFRPPVKNHPIFKIIIILTVFFLLSAIWGYLNNRYQWFALVASPLGFWHVTEWMIHWYIQAAALIIIPSFFNNDEDYRFIALAFFISTIIPCIIGLYQIIKSSYVAILIDNNNSINTFRIDGGLHGPGSLSIMMFVGIVSSLILYVTTNSKKTRFLFIVYGIVYSIILYFTFARTMWIATSILVSLMLIYFHKRYYLIVLITILVCISVLVPATRGRFQKELSVFNLNSTEMLKLGSGRLWLWNEARLHFIKLDPVSKIIGSGGYYGSHNQYIAILLRNGIVGLVIFLFFLYRLLKENSAQISSRNSKKEKTIIIIFLLNISVIFISNQFSHPWDNSTFSMFFWTLIGMVINPEKNADKIV